MSRSANDFDKHVAKRLLAARKQAGLSQEGAAEMLGITFQQLQKYEKGQNRVSVGRLVLLAKAYEVRPEYFFDGITFGRRASATVDLGAEMIATPRGVEMAHSFLAIEDAKARAVLVQVAEIMAAG